MATGGEWAHCMAAGDAALASGDYQAAEEAYLRAMGAGFRPPDFPGLWSRDFLSIFARLEQAYLAQGKEAEVEELREIEARVVEELARDLLPQVERSLGPDHPDVAAALHSLALAYHRMGKHAQAEAAEERARRIWAAHSLQLLGPGENDG